jgi:concanavalin A-like lectin/glucanase superfamily protein
MLLPGQGVFCNGQYIAEVSNGCDVQTPLLPKLTATAFTISARFLVPERWVKPHPVFVGGSFYRWLVYELQRDGSIRLIFSNVPVDCSVKYRLGFWHEATVTFDGSVLTLFLDGERGCSANVARVATDDPQKSPWQMTNDNKVLLTNFANASTFYGVVRDLKVFDAVVPPARRTPERADVTLPEPDLSPADRFLAACPTAEQVSSIDKDLRLSFEADPTAGEPLACTSAQGSRDLTVFKKAIYNTLRLMKRLEFDQPLPWTKEPLYTWFVRNIRGIRFRSDIANSACCDPARVLGIVTPNSRVPAFTSRWHEPALGGGINVRLGLFVHEARHAEGKPHTCGTRDNTLDELGAWGVNYYLLRWLAEHTDQAFFSSGSIQNSEVMIKLAERLRVYFCRGGTGQ